MDPVVHTTHDFLLDGVGLAADPRREVPAPAVVERGPERLRQLQSNGPEVWKRTRVGWWLPISSGPTKTTCPERPSEVSSR
jgi:hypothetical protein